MKTLGEFRNLIGKDEKAIGFRIMDAAGYISEVYEFIGPEDMDDRGDIAGCIEETLHTMIDNGWEPEDIREYLGLVNEDTYAEENSDNPETLECTTSIDLGYIIPGYLERCNFNRDNFRKKLYERFKYFWLADHGYSITDLVKGVMEYGEESYGDTTFHPYEQLVEDFETECGFGSEIYPCYSEFITSEYLDRDFMKTLCWNNGEEEKYLEDPYLKN